MSDQTNVATNLVHLLSGDGQNKQVEQHLTFVIYQLCIVMVFVH